MDNDVGRAEHGGDHVARVLQTHGVDFVFTLIGGHISPILVGCKTHGIRVIDVRHEVNAVFAADAVARLTGRAGVAVVTAGPGVTNTLTAVKNAQMAQSPVVLIGGAAATLLQGRGALQDIDQLSLFGSVVKWSTSVRRVRDLVPTLEKAFRTAEEGTPGPVFVEIPVDLLYGEELVREWYAIRTRENASLTDRAVQQYLKYHLRRLFGGAESVRAAIRHIDAPPPPDQPLVDKAAEALLQAERPVLLVGSQAVLDAPHVAGIARAVSELGIPTYLSGMARGLLGVDHPLQILHKRRIALKEADFVMLAGVPMDFRLDYGRHIHRNAFYVSANRNKTDLTKNRKPEIGLLGDPGIFLQMLAETVRGTTGDGSTRSKRIAVWATQLRVRDDERNAEIAAQSAEPTAAVNPLHFFSELERALPDNALLVADGGDFVGTASYTLQPRSPLTWLDPGPFGTLGVGAGFALGAKLVRPECEVWILYGDGAAGYSLTEFDTFVRHGIPLIAVVGNDASWSQIAREQVEILHDAVGTALRHTDYHRVAEGFGGAGLHVSDPELVGETIAQARTLAAAGQPVLINVILGKSNFRKGSLAM